MMVTSEVVSLWMLLNQKTVYSITQETGTLLAKVSSIQYLEENLLMQKAYKVAKESKDWLPLI